MTEAQTAVAPPTYREAHHGQLLVAIGVDRHQVSGLGVQDVPPDSQTDGQVRLDHQGLGATPTSSADV